MKDFKFGITLMFKEEQERNEIFHAIHGALRSVTKEHNGILLEMELLQENQQYHCRHYEELARIERARASLTSLRSEIDIALQIQLPWWKKFFSNLSLN